MNSPYLNHPASEWKEITEKLIADFPLSREYLVRIVIKSWDDILKITISDTLSINDVRPKPQIMGFFLHEIVAYKIEKDFPSKWRKEQTAEDKDLVCIFEPKYSFEIKTSSHENRIFGNRSYAQKTQTDKKNKHGYYLAINFEAFKDKNTPKIRLIRFGWIDHSDWQGQKAASGQQARLSTDVELKKLLTIYNR